MVNFQRFSMTQEGKKCILLASWEWVYLILWTLDWDVNSTFETSLLIRIMFLEILFEKLVIFRVYWVLYRVDETDHSYYILVFPDKIIIFSKVYFCCSRAIKKASCTLVNIYYVSFSNDIYFLNIAHICPKFGILRIKNVRKLCSVRETSFRFSI